MEGFGAYSLVLTFLILAVTIADLGMTPIGVRELARRPEETHRLVGNLLGLRFLACGSGGARAARPSGVVEYEREFRRDAARGARRDRARARRTSRDRLPEPAALELAMVVEIVSSATTLVLLIAVTTADLGFSAVVLATVGGAPSRR